MRRLLTLAFVLLASPALAQIQPSGIGVGVTPPIFGVASSGVTGSGILIPPQLLAGDGEASAPSYSFASDPDTGLFRNTANRLNIAAGGFDSFQFRGGAFTIYGSAAALELGDAADVSLSRGAANVLTLAAGDSFSYGVPGAATSAHRLIKKVTAIADNVATDVLTVTVPNAGQSAGIKLSFLSANGSTDAFESSRVAEGFVVLARTSGVATVATIAALDLAQIATVGGGATHTLAYGVSSMTGAVGATQTFTIQVTINDTGNTGGNQVVVVAEVLNSQASGVTIQ